jgi:hypothetical protein
MSSAETLRNPQEGLRDAVVNVIPPKTKDAAKRPFGEREPQPEDSRVHGSRVLSKNKGSRDLAPLFAIWPCVRAQKYPIYEDFR